MKKLYAFMLIVVFSVAASAATDKERLCSSGHDEYVLYAEWGRALRNDMLAACGKQPKQACKRKFEKELDRQSALDKQVFLATFADVADTDIRLRSYLAKQDTKELAARLAFESDLSVKDVLADAQRLCVAVPLEALIVPRPAPRRRAAPPPMPPIMPMPDLIGKPLTQPGATIAPISGGCTNHTIMGQNGQTVYCQKCCYGGNCNTYCN